MRQQPTWPWPLQLSHYDRAPLLSTQERAAIQAYLDASPRKMSASIRALLQRLLQPLHDALVYVGFPPPAGYYSQSRRVMLIEMYQRNTSFWAWSPEDWQEILALEHRCF